jgi:DNA-binding protein Fis
MQMLLDSTTVQDLKQYIEKKEGKELKHVYNYVLSSHTMPCWH